MFKDWYKPYPTHTKKTLKPFASREIVTNLNMDIVIKVTHLSLRAQERQEKVRQVRKKTPLT